MAKLQGSTTCEGSNALGNLLDRCCTQSTNSVVSKSLLLIVAHALVATSILLLFREPAAAQVFDPGPSDPSLFDTVINLPPDPNIGDGGNTSAATQLNVSDGGVVGNDFTANGGSEVNVSGGRVGQNFEALSGSEVSISGGVVGSSFEAHTGSTVQISGGTIGKDFDAIAGGNVEFIGGEFRVNGVDHARTTITLDPGDLFTGTLADGSTFLFTQLEGDLLIGEALTAAPLPALDTTPRVVTTDISNGPSGLRRGQSLTLQAGGQLGENFAMLDATLNVEGGTVGAGVEAVSSTLNISGGTVGSFDFYAGSHVSISGGTVVGSSSARSADLVTISGGTVEGSLSASGAGEVMMSGGTVEGELSTGNLHMTGGTAGRLFVGGNSVATVDGAVVTGTVSASGDARLNIEGGVFGSLRVDRNAEVNISAGTFTGNGFSRIRGSTVNISGGSFSGFLEVDSGGELNISGGTLSRTLRTRRLSTVRLSGGTIGQDYRAWPFGGGDLELIGGEFRLNGIAIGAGELALNEGDILAGTLADGSTFTMSPGLNDFLSAVTLTSAPLPPLDLTPRVIDTPVTEGRSGLRMGQSLSLQPGGELRNNFTVVSATLNIDGGIVGDEMEVVDGTVNLNSGSVGSDFSLLPGSTANIRGGSIENGIEVFAGSVVNLFGTEFLLEGLPLDALSLGETMTISDRDVSLTGRLADSSPFSFDLNANAGFSSPRTPDYFDVGATLTVTLVPEPHPIGLMLGGLVCLSVRRENWYR